uniref:Src homology 2 domain containing transforming protein D n=1 Tax=Crocodylus porosus TaxID=8502 RepID=A0A7M4DUV5_CROPO
MINVTFTASTDELRKWDYLSFGSRRPPPQPPTPDYSGGDILEAYRAQKSLDFEDPYEEGGSAEPGPGGPLMYSPDGRAIPRGGHKSGRLPYTLGEPRRAGPASRLATHHPLPCAPHPPHPPLLHPGSAQADLPWTLLQLFLPDVAVSCYQVSSQPSLFQAEEFQVPQPFLVWLAMQVSNHTSGPSLDLQFLPRSC